MRKRIRVPQTKENSPNATTDKTDLALLGIKTELTQEVSDEEIASEFLPELWVEHKNSKSLNEDTFAKWFIRQNGLQYCNGIFFTNKGRSSEGKIRQDLINSIATLPGFTHQRTGYMVDAIIKAIKDFAYVDNIPFDKNVIPFKNGNFYVKERLFRVAEITPTAYRLPVCLRQTKAPTPNFNKWLNDLFSDEDIPVIQQYLGYCLVPTNNSQKALFLVGEGGSGKSVLGVILNALLGNAMLTTSNTNDFLNDKFKLPELEHKLVMYDDDLDSQALTGTGLYKKLITNNLDITADRKYGQPFQFTPYAKLVSCCNEMLSAESDGTDGFFRRLLPIVTKPKADNFVPDLHFYDKVKAEAEGICLWAMQGLLKLIANDWEMTPSAKTESYLSAKKEMGNPFPSFFADVFEHDKDGSVSSVEIYNIYKKWCRANGVTYDTQKALTNWLTDNAEKLKITKPSHITSGGKRVRGYTGIRIAESYGEEDTIEI